jgi:hypothetical protein
MTRLFLNIKSAIIKCVPDSLYLKYKFKKELGYKLDLKHPVSYNEKCQWLKLHNRKKIYSDMVDKYKAKFYVEEKIGSQYVIPLLGHWEKFSDIDFNKLPEKFVLKTNHDSGGVWIINKNSANYEQIKKEAEEHLKHNFFWASREWPYKKVQPCLFAEKFMTDESGSDLKDYKFYCFDGKVKLLLRASDIDNGKEHVNNHKSHDNTVYDFYDENYNSVKINWGFNNSEKPLPLPENISELKAIAEKLSQGIPSVRVDLFTNGNNIYFGEFTFFDGAGFDKIEPVEWDYKLGSYITIV